MKLFKGLTLFAALAEAGVGAVEDDFCPNVRWSKVGEACVPS